ncbi:MAG: M15 family metallopeptidase [Filomicrobium sp.]
MTMRRTPTPARGCVAAFFLLFASASLAIAPAHAEGISLREKLAAFQDAFADRLSRITETHVEFVDGTSVVIDDGRMKTHQEKLKGADVEDMFSQIYPLGKCAKGNAALNFDPGRVRSDAVMRALFGNTRAEALSKQESVNWFGQRLPFTRVGGADKALMRVAKDLAQLMDADPGLAKFIKPAAGTFVWRNIAGTTRLSAHSFGAAIDINTKYSDYWRWSGGGPGKVPAYRNKIPLEIVEVFERHGFIWGGRWYHFDTMHFEYRPELIAIGRLAEERGCAG